VSEGDLRKPVLGLKVHGM